MPTSVKVVHDYPVTAQALWDLIIDCDKFEDIMRGIIEFEGMPSGDLFEGQKILVDVSLFGKLPKQEYHMHVVSFDEERMCFHSSEKGAGVKSWEHICTVVPTSNGCTLHDEIEIDAGFLTPLFALWAKYLYKARHAPRLSLLGVST